MKIFRFIVSPFLKFFGGCVSLFWGTVSRSKQSACILQMLLGAAVMLIPLAYSFFTILLPKTPAVFITFAGAAAGTWLFQKGLRRYVQSVPAEALVDKDEYIRRGKKIEQLAEEKSRLQNMGLNVDSIKTLLSVNLLEIETHLRDFKKQEVADTVESGIFTNTRIIREYLGYIDEKIKAKYGVDLTKIRIREENSKIVVSGIKCEYQGIREQETVAEHYEIREKKVSAHGPDDGTVKLFSHQIAHDKNNLLLDTHKEHVEELKRKLNSGVDLTGLEGANAFVENLGREFVKNFFLPTGKQIEFVAESAAGGYTLEEFAANHNRSIKAEAEKKEKEIKFLESE